MTRWRRLAWQAVWIVGLLLWAMPGWSQTVHYPAFLTLSGGATLNGVVYGAGTSSLLSTAQGPANSVLTANAGAPSFSSSPQVSALGAGVAAGAAGTITANGNLITNSAVQTNTIQGNGNAVIAVSDTLNLATGKFYQVNGVNGVSSTATVCSAGACTSTCTMIFTAGIRTGGTC